MGNIQEMENYSIIARNLDIKVNLKMDFSMDMEFNIIIQKIKFMKESLDKDLNLEMEKNLMKKQKTVFLKVILPITNTTKPYNYYKQQNILTLKWLKI